MLVWAVLQYFVLKWIGVLANHPNVQFMFCFLEVVLMFQPSVAVFYCFCFDVHAFLCVPSHSALSRIIFSVVYLQYKLIEPAEAVFWFA